MSARPYDDPLYRRNRARILGSSPPCVRCGMPATTVDHRVPLAAGGTHDAANLQPMCKRCNSSKADRMSSHRSRRLYRR